MGDFECWTADRRFGFRLGEKTMTQLLSMCANSDRLETGGILIGFYNEDLDCAMAIIASGSPTDSRADRNWFHRGIRGLQRWLDRLWYQKHHYYLGEWHYHPRGAAIPSLTDIAQLESIANSNRYSCPEPILLIIGFIPEEGWGTKVFVFPRGQGYTELQWICPTRS